MTPRRYWDSDCFLGWFNDERDKADACAAVIHLPPTALLSKVPYLDTFDGGLIALDRRLGDPPLRIGHPRLERQGELFSPTGAPTPDDPDSAAE